MYHLAAAMTIRGMSLNEYLVRQLAGKEKEDGNSTETVIIIAALALLAIGVVGVITYKVMTKVNNISLDGGQ
jgi:hypothetical protein